MTHRSHSTTFSSVRPWRLHQVRGRQPSTILRSRKASEVKEIIKMSNIIRFKLTYLEKIVFEKIPHRFVSWNSPPGVKVEVQYVQPGHQHEGGQLGLVPHSDQHHQQRSNQVLDNLASVILKICFYKFNLFLNTCMADISNLRSVRNMNTRRILPAS